MDMKTNSAWTKSAFKDFRENHITDSDCLFLCDNLNSQTTDSFEGELRDECRATLQLGPPNATHISRNLSGRTPNKIPAYLESLEA